VCAIPHLQAQLTTSQWDNARTGANLHETLLTPANVASAQFGKRFSLPLDGDPFAQPLIVPNVPIPAHGTHTVLYIATQHDSVYAFDATHASDPLWHVNFLRPRIETTVTPAELGCPLIAREIGITATPVIDLATGTLYVVARSAEHGGLRRVRYVQRLHALSIENGAEKFGGPVEINAPGFDTLRQNARAGLLLTNGQIVITWGSACDVMPYSGWVMAYDARTLRRTAVFNASPHSGESGIWQSGMAPATDAAGNIYLSTGNGKLTADRDHGQSVLKLHFEAGHLGLLDCFTPRDHEALSANDIDIGSGGPLLLPHLLLTGGKNGVLHVFDPDHLSHPLQTVNLGHAIYSAPAYWNGHVYIAASGDVVSDFHLDRGRLPDKPSVTGRRRFDSRGGTPTISADADRNAIVWLLESKPWNTDSGPPAVLHAYDAADVARELFSSDAHPRDRAGSAVRFTMPAVFGGRVYIGVRHAIDVYGLAGTPALPLVSNR
jgi:hypothetical protein